MSHRLRATSTAHFYAEVETGENRRGETVTAFDPPNGEVAVAEVRVTDAGGSYAQMQSGEVALDNTILTAPAWLDAEVAAGQRCALEGDGFAFDADAPAAGDYYEVTSADRLFSRGRSVRGVEIVLEVV